MLKGRSWSISPSYNARVGTWFEESVVRLVPAVGQNIGVRLELRRRHVEVDLLGVSAPSVAEGFNLHDDEIEVGFRRRPVREPNGTTHSGVASPTTAHTIRSSSAVSGPLGGHSRPQL